MINRETEAITESDLQALITDSVAEGKTIEYKGELSLGNDDQKKKFLAGVASFANASGGDMVFGIVATDGNPVAIKPLANFNPDADILRLRDIIRAGIDAKIVLIEFKAVSLASGGNALVVRIRKSWAGAHMVTYNNDYRFYARDLAGRRPMDVSEIRSAFTLTESVTERVNRFRQERIGNIVAGETPQPLAGKAFTVVHLLPLRSFDPTFECDLKPLRSSPGLLKPMYSGGWGPSNDFEGYLAHNKSRESATSYVLAFRNGCIESVETRLLEPSGPDGQELKIFPSGIYEKEIMASVLGWFRVLKTIGAEPPVVLMLSIIGVKGYFMYMDARYFGHEAREVGKDSLIFPGTVIESLDVSDDQTQQNNIYDLMRPSFDALWNACGFDRSYNFDDAGSWKPFR